jgi:hypothetical protein
MPLGPLHAACVQPAPKSRFVVFAPLMSKNKINSRNSRTRRQWMPAALLLLPKA